MYYKLIALDRFIIDSVEGGKYKIIIRDLFEGAKKDKVIKEVIFSEEELDIFGNIIDHNIPEIDTSQAYTFNEICIKEATMNRFISNKEFLNDCRKSIRNDLDVRGAIYKETWIANMNNMIEIFEYIENSYFNSDSYPILLFVDQS